MSTFQVEKFKLKTIFGNARRIELIISRSDENARDQLIKDFIILGTRDVIIVTIMKQSDEKIFFKVNFCLADCQISSNIPEE